MNDPFLKLIRPGQRPRTGLTVVPARGRPTIPVEERDHSKYAASASERWFHCPGSVELSEGLPDKSSPWAKEGSRAHEILEAVLKAFLSGKPQRTFGVDSEMLRHAVNAANFVMRIAAKARSASVLVETRIYLSFIHPEMFGTFDAAVVDHWGTLHVFDYKYGAGHHVSVKKNLQMIFYGIGLAHRYHWNFKRVRLWIIQPRIRGYDGPVFEEMTTAELRAYVPIFRKAVERVIREPGTFKEGRWCHWCRAKSICPLKREAKMEEAMSVFTLKPVDRKRSRDLK